MELIVRVLPGDGRGGAGREERVAVERDAEGLLVRVGERSYRVDPAVAGRRDRTAPGWGLRSLLVGGAQNEVGVRREGGRAAGGSRGRYRVTTAAGAYTVEVLDPLSHLAERAHARSESGGPVRVAAYMPGRVVTVLVEEGQEVTAGQGLLVLEAMKMENEVQAERPGTVRRVLVRPGQAVEGGEPLLEIG